MDFFSFAMDPLRGWNKDWTELNMKRIFIKKDKTQSIAIFKVAECNLRFYSSHTAHSLALVYETYLAVKLTDQGFQKTPPKNQGAWP